MDEENQLIQQSNANLPCLDLLTGDRENYIKFGLPLYKASVKGDWEAAKVILDQKPELVRYSITENGDTPLHVVAAAKQTIDVKWFVRNLVYKMNKDEVALENKNQDNALYLACVAGNIETVKVLVERNSALLINSGIQGKMMPLQAAAFYGHHEVVKYLYEKSNDLTNGGWTEDNRSSLLLNCVETDMFDIALRIVKKYPNLGRSGSVLGVLARKPKVFKERNLHMIDRTTYWAWSCSANIKYLGKDSEALQLLRIIWGDISKKPKNVIDDILRGPPNLRQDNMLVSGNADETYSSRILFIAAEMENTIFIIELIRQYPDLIWQVNDNNQSIFHIAIQNRHEDIYNLLYEIGGMKDLITHLRDEQDNNLLHIVAKSVNQRRLNMVRGVFQMQRDLLWFLEIESMIPPSYREQKNKDGLTPRELFTKEHKSLHAQAENWMKKTASQSMVIAVLVATIAFAAAFTIPGGYDQNGIPNFRSNKAFLVFIISDAISLLSSSASIFIMFLSIQMSPYAEGDFLFSVPSLALLGLGTLFLSLLSMLIAFCASFFVLYDKQLIWIPILIAIISAYPIYFYAMLQHALLRGVIQLTILLTYGLTIQLTCGLTYDTGSIFNPNKNVLY